jgi:acyl-CoA synthetase (AMP-forming)/AMP-acid ligase II
MRVNLIDLLRDRAAAQPDSTAFTFLEAGEHEGASLTWADVDLRSRAIAAAVQSRVRPGDRVLVMLPPGVEFVPAFFGVIYAGAIAIPTYPPAGAKSDRTSARLRGMIADAGISLVVSCSTVLSRRTALAALVPELAGLPWIAVDAVAEDLAEAWRIPSLHDDTLALLQYTSGSTAAPRGVMVSHGNLLHNLGHSAALARHDHQSVSVSWLPVNHDMGLIDGVLQPVSSGFAAYLMAPAAFLQRPSRWLQAISRYGATHSGGPNFAYDLCARRIADDERDALDLSTWRIAFNGSEPIRRSTMEGFHRRFAPCGFRWEAFRPAYGLAESTLLVTSSRPGDAPSFIDIEPGRSLVSCGVVNCAPRIRIVEPATRTAVHEGAVGEIWVSSDSVARGYWNRPRESAATFHAYMEGTHDGPYLRTGDLGCIVEGRLFVTGRIKDLLIVRGVKHYPQDIEATVERAHPILRPGSCAAFAVQQTGDERIAIVAEVEPRRDVSAAELEHAMLAVRRTVSEVHQVAPLSISLITAGTLPKTTSGKLQRFLCRDGLAARTFEVLASWSETVVVDAIAS